MGFWSDGIAVLELAGYALGGAIFFIGLVMFGLAQASSDAGQRQIAIGMMVGGGIILVATNRLMPGLKGAFGG